MNIIYGSMGNVDKSVRFDNIVIAEPFKNSRLLLYLPQFNFIPKSLSPNKIFHDFELEYSVFENQFQEFKAKYNTPVSRMSGGERRLIELYVIVRSKTKFAMLDEPFTHLNPIQVDIIQDIIIKEKRKRIFDNGSYVSIHI
jgi:ABC-type lipopolysaccharide export system ATPase subunit